MSASRLYRTCTDWNPYDVPSRAYIGRVMKTLSHTFAILSAPAAFAGCSLEHLARFRPPLKLPADPLESTGQRSWELGASLLLLSRYLKVTVLPTTSGGPGLGLRPDHISPAGKTEHRNKYRHSSSPGTQARLQRTEI